MEAAALDQLMYSGNCGAEHNLPREIFLSFYGLQTREMEELSLSPLTLPLLSPWRIHGATFQVEKKSEGRKGLSLSPVVEKRTHGLLFQRVQRESKGERPKKPD